MELIIGRDKPEPQPKPPIIRRTLVFDSEYEYDALVALVEAGVDAWRERARVSRSISGVNNIPIGKNKRWFVIGEDSYQTSTGLNVLISQITKVEN